MNCEVTIIGTLGAECPYISQNILDLLNKPQSKLVHGQNFTGRPSTQIYASEQDIVKIRSEFKFPLTDAKRWVEQTLTKERNYQVHHPQKTWFVAQVTGEEYAIIGSICPRLVAISSIFAQQPDTDLFLELLSKIFAYYFYMAKQLNLRLDEGLSNFGVDENYRVYYLDDDVYNWDKFNACAQILGVYLRSYNWLRDDIAYKFGLLMRDEIYAQYADKQYFTVLAELLRDLFLPNEAQQLALERFTAGLLQKENSKTKLYQNVRYLAILADIHANLPALEAVLAFLHTKNIEYGIVIGDIVGYGPHPIECIELLQQSKFDILKGNHDHALATGQFKRNFSSTAQWVLDWSDKFVGAKYKSWLEELPPILHGDNWLAVHGAPLDPTFFNAYVYEMTYQENLNLLERKRIKYCFHGHTHQPGVYARKGHLDKHYSGEVIDLSEFNYALICPGSVGQPRNRKIGAQFAIYDREEQKVYFHRLLYNVNSTVHDMEQQQFPGPLINLLKGYGYH
jgi:predicted phosphodiesterase